MKAFFKFRLRAAAQLLACFVVLFALIVPHTFAADSQSADEKAVNEVYELIKSYHVSGIDEQQLKKSSIDAMLKTLNDPYTQYMTESEWAQFNGSLEGNYTGIGIRVGQDENGFYVDRVFPGSPAEANGMLQGDYIVAVDGKAVKGKRLDELVNSVMGPENSEVTVTIMRNSAKRDIRLTRHRIQLPVVDGAFFPDGTGYIRVSSFSDKTDEQFAEQLDEMKRKGIRSLVVDLRDNPGGLVETAKNIAALFIKEGAFMHVKGRDNVIHPLEIKNGQTVAFPVVLLVNGWSASASEILAGALQDYHVATVVGTRTYGKGSVQNIFPLSDGGVLKLTVEEYLTPKLRKVNKTGLKPDIEIFGEAAQLITALHAAGMENVQITFDRHSLSVNGIGLDDRIPYVQRQTRIYVPSRVLSAMISAKVNWNPKTKQVEIDSGGVKKAFGAADGALLLDKGTGYIELSAFHDAFAQLLWKAEGNKITLLTAKGN